MLNLAKFESIKINAAVMKTDKTLIINVVLSILYVFNNLFISFIVRG